MNTIKRYPFNEKPKLVTCSSPCYNVFMADVNTFIGPELLRNKHDLHNCPKCKTTVAIKRMRHE